jgi:DNA polymerase III epsilon subunit-like protein
MKMFTIYFDLETGGVMPQHPSIQLAAVAISDADGSELGSFERKLLFNEAACDQEALKINHYDADAWKKNAVPINRAASDFAAFAKPYACVEMVSKRTGNPYGVAKLAGHNAVSFDLPRLRDMFGTQFFPFSYHVKDTLQRAIWYFDEHPEIKRPENLKLGTLATFFGVPVDESSHDALVDVRLSAGIAAAIKAAERKAVG